MARIAKKHIRFGTGTVDVNSRVIPANFTPVSYTPTQVASEGTDKISAHLNGIDSAIGSLGAVTGDIGLTSFSAANNQSSAANVTGFAFANGTTRAFSAIVSVTIIATSNLYETFEIKGIQKDSDWAINYDAVGDASGVVFSITSSGQLQYTSTNISGFTSSTIKFRAQTTTV